MDKTKNIIWVCTLITLVSNFAINNTILKLLCTIIPIILAFIIIYKNTPKIVNLSDENIKIKTVRNAFTINLLFLLSSPL